MKKEQKIAVIGSLMNSIQMCLGSPCFYQTENESEFLELLALMLETHAELIRPNASHAPQNKPRRIGFAPVPKGGV